jgi:hypothetical protein
MARTPGCVALNVTGAFLLSVGCRYPPALGALRAAAHAGSSGTKWCVLDAEFTTLAHHRLSQSWYILTHKAFLVGGWGMAMASGVRFLTVCIAGGATKPISSSTVAPGQGSPSMSRALEGESRLSFSRGLPVATPSEGQVLL